jgi:nucleotide-binding universal stress UspA family protein
MMGATFLLLCGVELTLAHTKPDALFFVTCVLLIGLALRAWSQKYKGITTVQVPSKVAEMVEKLRAEDLAPSVPEGGKILLYLREVAVAFGASTDEAKARWQDDPEAALIMRTAQAIGEQSDVKIIPVYAVAEKAGTAIADAAATLGVDELYLGASGHTALAHLLHGSVVQQVVRNLPDEIAVVIRG